MTLAPERTRGSSSRSPGSGARIDWLIAQAEGERSGLRRTMGSVSLTAIGIALVIGAGIFVLTGEAAARYAGPAVAISFLLAGLAAGLSALCYAELASTIPVSGSTYSYAYGVLGVFVGWVVGWNLLLEYLVGAAAIAAGWGGYVDNVLASIGLGLPDALLGGPLGGGGAANLPAAVIVAGVTGLLLLGTRESARATNVLVALKIGILALFVAVGAFHVSAGNLTPFVPASQGGFGEFGWSGMLRAAGLVFFSFIGFDAVCTAAQEAREPRRTVPIAVLSALGVATALYVLVALVMTGIAPYQTLASPDALTVALSSVGGLDWLERLVDVVAMLTLAASVLAALYGQSRILLRMAADGLVPAALARVDPRSGAPRTAILACGIGCATLAALVPLTTLADLVSAGTLVAFALVAVALLALRRARPDLASGFRVPGGSIVPVAAIVVDVLLVLMIPAASLVRLVAWMILGVGVYLVYGRERASRTLAQRAGAPAVPPT